MNAISRLHRNVLFQWALLYVLLISFQGCKRGDIDPEPARLTSFQEEAIAYFQEVALGFEFGSASQVTRKWQNSMKIYISGNPENYMLGALQGIVGEINSMATDGFQIQMVADSLQSNYHLYFGSGTSYSKLYPSESPYVDSNWGLFTVYWNSSNSINRGRMYVDIFRADHQAQTHLLREELTQSLGLARDSDKYPNSIFQQAWTYTQEYSDLDKELIRLLYHPQMKTGLDATQVEQLIKEIYQKENKAL